MIRSATLEDVPNIVAMSRKFYATTMYSETVPFDADTVWDLVEMLIATSVMLVAEVDSMVVGMAGALVSPNLFNRNISTACEIVWWVDPEQANLGAGKKLFERLQAECKELEAKALQMVTLASSPKHAAMIYERAGFVQSETSYTKVL